MTHHHGKTPEESAFTDSIIAPRSAPRTVSWWSVPMDRETFDARAKQELPGMQAGTFGRRETHQKGLTF